MRLDHAEREAESKAGSSALRLGREEWFEDTTSSLGRDPRAVVRNLNFDGSGLSPRPTCNAEFPLAADVLQGMLGIDDEVDEHLVQLVRVAVDRRQGCAQCALNADPA